MSARLRPLAVTAGFLALTSLVAACGETRQTVATTTPVAPAAGAASVELAMEDIKFDQTQLTVAAGQTIEFRFTNTGLVTHDAFIGDADAQAEHGAEMAESGDDGHHADDGAAVILGPGEAGTLSYTFDTPGTYEIGCHQPGHYAAGMKIDVTVG